MNQYSTAQNIRFSLFTDFKKKIKKLQNKNKVFEEFQDLPRFPRKMVLYSPTKFAILKSWINVPLPRKFYLGFWKSSKQIHGKLEYKKKVFEVFKIFSLVLRRMVLNSLAKLCHYKALSQYYMTQKIRFRLLIKFKRNL